jgi:hypothetical protein
VTFPYAPMPLSRHPKRTLEAIGYKPSPYVRICIHCCSPRIQSQTIPMQAFSTEGLRSESIAATYPPGSSLLWSAQSSGTLFAPYSRTRRMVGRTKELCNTEDKICYFIIVVCMHGSLPGKTAYGKISPLKKSTKSESLTNFSVLPSPTLLISKSLRVRVINV